MRRALFCGAIAAAGVAVALPFVASADHRPGHQQPSGPNPDLTISADPNRVLFGRTTTISGRLRGPDKADKEIELGENPYPFRDNDRFKRVGTTTTDAKGDYSFQVTPELNTNYRTRAEVEPEEVSGPVFVRVRMRINRRVDDRRPERGQLVTFSGKVVPEHDDMNVLIQRRRPTGTWRTLANVGLEPGPPTEDRSVYTHQIEINRDGVWRAKIRRDEDHLGNKSRRIRLNVP
jgi:hypothetical protein